MIRHYLNRRKLPLRHLLLNRRGLTALIFDQFAGADGTLLTAHAVSPTNLPGSSWQTGATSLALNSGMVQPGADGSLRVNHIETEVSDGVVECDLILGNTPGAGDYGQLVFRYTDEGNHWLAIISKASDSIKITERTSSASTTRAEDTAYAYTPEGSYHLKVSLSGTSIALEVSGDAASALSYASAVRQTETICGLRAFTDGTSTARSRFDHFKVSA